MTTHDAIELRPHTPIHWLNPSSPAAPTLHGQATLDDKIHVRIVWNDTVEPDSLIRTTDRIMLAAIHITNPQPEPGS